MVGICRQAMMMMMMMICPRDGGDDNDDDDEVDDYEGLLEYSNHDKIPPWWRNVSNDKGGNVSVSNSHYT